jgi:hypothetical protein
MAATMSHTRRVPIARQHTMAISPRALDLFVELKRAQASRRGAACIRGDDPSGRCSGECAACRRAGDLDADLHEELGLRPWIWPATPHNPFPPGSPSYRSWKPDPDGAQWALWQKLNEALRLYIAGNGAA